MRYTGGMQILSALLAQQNISNPIGLFAILTVVVVILYGLSIGKTRALISLLSMYVAYVLTATFPFLGWLQLHAPGQYASLVAVAVFAIFYAVPFLVISTSVAKGRMTLGEVSAGKVMLISVVQLGLLSSMVLSLLPLEIGQRLLGAVYAYAAGTRALWGWAVISLVILPFIRSDR
jgi:hypothetical protein